MRLFPSELIVNFDDGFSEENDIFKRKEFGQILTKIVSSTNSPLVIALEGQWGSGKTTFLKMWAGELKKQNFPVVFFDAFEADYHADAFLPLVAQIVSLARSTATPSKSKDFIKQATSVGKILARGAINIGVKVATVGALDGTILEEVSSEIAAGTKDIVEKHVSDIILGKEKEDATRESFSKSLSTLVERLNENSEIKKPLIFIIDELDRAKPDFSLSILEKIKHFFSSEGVHFILGTNLHQLRATIKHAYGSDTDANIYLEKFIHFTLRLSDDGGRHSSRNAETYASKLERAMEFPQLRDGAGSYAVKFIGKIASVRAINLRSVERIMTNLAIAIASTPENYIFPPAIVAGIAVIKSTNTDLFNRILDGKADFIEIISELGLDETSQETRDRELYYAQEEWRRFMGPLTEEETQKQFSRMFNYNFERREDVVQHIAERFARPTLMRVEGGNREA